MPTPPLPLLIIGAGPFGLSLSAYAKHKNIGHTVVGQSMDFWKKYMPKEMYLRSSSDWHYDPLNEDTIEKYLQIKNLKLSDVEPFALDFYLGYVEWFIKQKQIEVTPAWVQQLNYTNGTSPLFEAVMQDGTTLIAKNVALALGIRYFKNIPEPFPTLLPPKRFAHTMDLIDFTPFKNKRVLIIGGRQSAFEWAAMIHEHNAAKVYLSYRHPTPNFQQSDWSWVNPLIDGMVANPNWYRQLPQEEKEQVNRRFWAEGRLKLEPWLAKRITKESIQLFPESQVTACKELPSGELEVTLTNSTTIIVDEIVLATGYKVNVNQVPLLANGNLLSRLKTNNGFPMLDEHLQSNLQGLFFTGICATQDFGSFFAFTAAIRTSAKLIGAAIKP